MWGQNGHQPVSKRKEKQTVRKMCRLQITEAGLRMFKGKSVSVQRVLPKLQAWTGPQGVSMLRL